MPKKIEKFCELRGRITAKGYTVRDLARCLGLAPSTLSLKLCAKAEMTLNEAYKIMSVLAIPQNQMHVYFPKDGQP